jgi:hypothetical protein
MNQKFIQSAILGSLMFGVLVFGNFDANANGFHKKANKNGEVVSANQFYAMLDHTSDKEVAVTFGLPDTISTLKDADGSQAGVVWTYKNAVAKDSKELDANFVFVAGKFKYVTLSSS